MKCWVYHKTESPKIVDKSEAEKYYADGWADSPAKFLDLSEVIDMTDETQVQVAGETMDDLKDRANALVNIESVRRPGILKIAEDFDVVDEDMSTKELRAYVREYLSDNSD